MNTEKLEKLYLINGFIGLAQFIVIMYVAFSHFAVGSIVFSKLVPFCVVSAFIGFFSLNVSVKQKFTKYTRTIILNSRTLFYVLVLNLVVSAIIIIMQ